MWVLMLGTYWNLYYCIYITSWHFPLCPAVKWRIECKVHILTRIRFPCCNLLQSLNVIIILHKYKDPMFINLKKCYIIGNINSKKCQILTFKPIAISYIIFHKFEHTLNIWTDFQTRVAHSKLSPIIKTFTIG